MSGGSPLAEGFEAFWVASGWVKGGVGGLVATELEMGGKSGYGMRNIYQTGSCGEHGYHLLFFGLWFVLL